MVINMFMVINVLFTHWKNVFEVFWFSDLCFGRL